MSLGCPFICSPVSSLPEVAGNAALLPSHQPGEYLQTVHLIFHESELREELVGRSRVQGARFTWRACAHGTLEVYREAAEH